MADLSILVKILASNSASGALHAVTNDLERMGVQSARSGGLLGTVAGVGMAAVAGAGLAVAGGLGFAVKQAMDFESVMSGVGAVSSATGEELSSLSAMALQIGKDTKFTATEAGQAMEELVKAGIPVEDILNGAASAAVNLAAAGATSIPSAAAIMAGAMNAFNIAGTDAAHVADIITGAANESMINVEEFGIGFGQLAAVANLTGFSLEDTATALAILTSKGIQASDAGTSLKTMFLQLNPQTKKARELMAELGIITADGRNQFFDANGEVRSLSAVTQVLTDALSDLTDEERILALKQLFGQDAVRAGAILFQEGAAGVNKMKEALEGTSAADIARIRMDNLAGALEMMKGSISTLAITFGLELMPVLQEGVEGITELINAAIPWAAEHAPAFAQAAREMIAAFIPWIKEHGPAILQGLADFASTTVTVVGAIFSIIGAVNEFLTPLGGLGAALPIVIGLMGVSGLLGAFSGLLGPIMAVAGLIGGPLVLAILGVTLAVGGLAIAWANDWMSIRTNTQTAVSEIGPMLDTVISKWQEILAFASNPTQGAFNAIQNAMPTTNPQLPSSEEGPTEASESEPFIPVPTTFPTEGEEFSFHSGGVVPGIGTHLVMARGGELIAKPVAEPVSLGGGGGISFGGISISVGAANLDEVKRQVIEQFTAEIEIAFDIARGMGTPFPISLQNRT